MNKSVKEQITNLDDFILKYVTMGFTRYFDSPLESTDLLEEYKAKLLEVDKYTDGLGSYIVKLIYYFWKEWENKKYQNFFGDDWLRHWKLDYDPQDIVYVEENGSIEFEFYNKHHPCLCPYGGKFIISRMVAEIRDYLLPVSQHLGRTFGRDSYIYKQFYNEHEKFLTYEDGYNYETKIKKENYLGYGRYLKYCNLFRYNK